MYTTGTIGAIITNRFCSKRLRLRTGLCFRVDGSVLALRWNI